VFEALVEIVFPAQCAGCSRLGNALCDRCFPASPEIEVVLPTLAVKAVGEYEGALRSAILALKSGRRDVAAALAARMAAFIPPGAAIVPVPTTLLRRRMRGFDGGVLLARIAARTAGAQVLEALSHASNDMQRGRGRRERLAARGRFACDTDALAGARVVLLDDVVTTGATLEDCAACLRDRGAIVERAVVAAAARPNGREPPEREPLRK
jgi:ComF family protein